VQDKRIPNEEKKRHEDNIFTIDEEFFSNEILPLIFGILMSGLNPNYASLLVIIYGLNIAVNQHNIKEDEVKLFLKHFVRIPCFCEWNKFESNFVSGTELASIDEANELIKDLVLLYPDLSILNGFVGTHGQSQADVNCCITQILSNVNTLSFSLMKQINVKLLLRNKEVKSLINEFVHHTLSNILDISYEPIKFHKFIKTASWPLPIMVHSADSLNIVNIICSIASFYGVGLEVLRTDDDILLDKERIEYETIASSKYWPFESISKPSQTRDLIESDDKIQSMTIQGSLELIKDCALQGNWVLISTIKIVSYWDKVCNLFKELFEQGKISHSFRLFIDWQFMSKCHLPESMIYNKALLFYLTEANADDMEGYNDIWAHILNGNILDVTEESKRYESGIKTEDKSLALSGLNSLSYKNESHREIFFIGRGGDLSKHLSRISYKSYNDDTISHTNKFNL